MILAGYKLIKFSFYSYKNSYFIHKVTDILAQHNANIIDISQYKAFQSHLLSVSIEATPTQLNRIKEEFSKLNDTYINTQIIYSDTNNEVITHSKECSTTHYLTLVGKTITEEHFHHIFQTLYQENIAILSMRELSQSDQPNCNSFKAIELDLNIQTENTQSVLSHLKELIKIDIDFSLQQNDVFRKTKRLICFDMDSTLIQTEVIDELAIKAGVGEQVKAITESAMRGEIDFKQSFAKRVSLLKGLSEEVMIGIAQNLPYTAGIEKVMKFAQFAGIKVAILSGGFTYFAKHIQEKFGVDYIYANNLEIIDGKLTGKYVGEVVDAQQKVRLLKQLASKENINLAQTVVVGDGANDLPMIKEAGLGIAFHAKPKVLKEAPNIINKAGLDAILYYLGYNDSEIGDALSN